MEVSARTFGRFTVQDLEEIAGYRMRTSPRIGFGERAAVLVIDMTRDVVEAFDGCRNAAGNIARLLPVARKAGCPIIYTRGGRYHLCGSFAKLSDGEKGLYPVKQGVLCEFQIEESQFEIADEIAPCPDEVVITKLRNSAFNETFLQQILTWNRIDTLIVTGESTTGCIQATANDGFSNNYRVVIPEECCAVGTSTDEAMHYITLLWLDKTKADVLPLSSVIDHLNALANSSAGPS